MSVIRKLIKVSTNSYAIVIPKAAIKKYGWKEHQNMSVKDKGRGALELRDARTKRAKRPKRTS